jgi:hypothetical protein
VAAGRLADAGFEITQRQIGFGASVVTTVKS